MREFLTANGDLVDIVSIHRYPFPSSMDSGAATIDELRANSREWEEIIPNLRALIQETTGREIPVAVTEVNSHWSNAYGGEASPDSFYNAIWWGDVLGRLIRQRVEIVAYFSLQSNASIGGYGLLGRSDLRPTYYVYQLYKHFGDELLYANSDNPDISIYAAEREDGALTVILINLTPDITSESLYLHDLDTHEITETWLLDIEHPGEQIPSTPFENGAEITLPPQSITLLIFK